MNDEQAWGKNDHNAWLYKYNSLDSSWSQSFSGVRETDGDKWRRRETNKDCHIDP